MELYQDNSQFADVCIVVWDSVSLSTIIEIIIYHFFLWSQVADLFMYGGILSEFQNNF